MEMKKMNPVDELDEEDVVIRGFLGDRFHDMSEAGKEPAHSAPQTAAEADEDGYVEFTPIGKDTPTDAPWKPAGDNFMDRLRSMVKTTVPLGVASGVVFWWQLGGHLTDEAAVPALIALAALMGITVGKYALK